MKLLITFGCSWTYGVGVSYLPEMSLKEYQSSAWKPELVNRYSFRGILCQRHNMVNINFSDGGSSNQQQFRSAEDFFSSLIFKEYQKQFDEIIVLWGITSVYRNEAYFPKLGYQKSFMYHDMSRLSNVIIEEHFDVLHEVNLLAKKICFWDNFFRLCNVKNIWFDTFNHHDYVKSIHPEIHNMYLEASGANWPQWEQFILGNFDAVTSKTLEEILNPTRGPFYKECYDVTCNMFQGNSYPRDLMSLLAIKNGMNNTDSRYHFSIWADDHDQVNFLVERGLLNPYSYHPTAEAHIQIADMLDDLVK